MDFFIDFFADRNLFLLLHIVSFAIGLGGATIADIFFFKFLKDFRISEAESETLDTLSRVIWVALGVIVVSGVGLYLPNAEALNQVPKFLVKMIVVGVLIVNGIFLNLLVAPRLVKIAFHQKHFHEKNELHHIRKIAFALGAISITSWYSAFFLGFLPKNIPFNFSEILLAYFLILGVAVVGSQIFDHFFVRQKGA